jgi:hypothetical protein
MACAHQIIRNAGPWETEGLWAGRCDGCTPDAGNAACPGFHEVPDPETPKPAVPPPGGRAAEK